MAKKVYLKTIKLPILLKESLEKKAAKCKPKKTLHGYIIHMLSKFKHEDEQRNFTKSD